MQNMTMKDIAKPLCKDPSTISKEIKKHRTFHPHNDLASRGPVNKCIHKKDCSLNEYIRYILPKGSSFDALSQREVDRVMNHINSSARASLNGLPPIRLAQLLFDQETYNTFKFREISPDDIILTPDLLK